MIARKEKCLKNLKIKPSKMMQAFLEVKAFENTLNSSNNLLILRGIFSNQKNTNHQIL